jgi:hypothetical protein
MWIESHDHGYANLPSQVLYAPGGTAEKIVKSVEGMSFRSRNGRIGPDRLEHSVLGSLAQTHHPTEQYLDVCLKRRLCEYRQKALQNRVDRGYARKHGWGPPCPLRLSKQQSLQGTPSCFHYQIPS